MNFWNFKTPSHAEFIYFWSTRPKILKTLTQAFKIAYGSALNYSNPFISRPISHHMRVGSSSPQPFILAFRCQKLSRRPRISFFTPFQKHLCKFCCACHTDMIRRAFDYPDSRDVFECHERVLKSLKCFSWTLKARSSNFFHHFSSRLCKKW